MASNYAVNQVANALSGSLGGTAVPSNELVSSSGSRATPIAKPIKGTNKKPKTKKKPVSVWAPVNTIAANKYADKLNQAYAEAQAAMQKRLNDNIYATNQEHDANARQAYMLNQRQQNALGEQLANSGINGGASETARVALNNNYAMNLSNNSTSRGSAISNLRSAYEEQVANLRAQTDAKIADALYNAEQADNERKDKNRDSYISRYAATVTRFDTEKKCLKEIKRLNKTNYPHRSELIWLAKQQLAVVRANKKRK